MAGLIAALFGGKSRPPDPDPMPGLGGYAMGPGPANQSGFPGSTSQTRTFPGNNPRGITGDWTTIKADTNYGFEQGLSSLPQTRQESFRGDLGGSSPRTTPPVSTPQPLLTAIMQNNNPTEFYGGQPLKTQPGSNNIGGNPLGRDGIPMDSVRDTETPMFNRNIIISGNVPGSNNVRNQVAQRYKNVPGQFHAYQSAARPDQAPVNPGGQATDGNVHPERVRDTPVVPNRFVYAGGAYVSYAMLRLMPYSGRGNGARGADLNGSRYYAEGQSDQFWNAGQGEYGIARQRGSQAKFPVAFTEPAPWTQNLYMTTDSVGTTDQPGTGGQSPAAVYISPSTGRASNSTGRTG